jgi:transcription antitermination factor NusG
MTARNTDWAILTCSNCKTLELVGSLVDAGFEAWAPVTREIARPSAQRTREEIAVPLMAGFVFAPAAHLHTLLAMSHSPALQYRVWDTDQRRMVVKGHPAFRVFRGGSHRFVPDHELEALRRLERKPRPKRIERTFNIGDRVRTDDGGFAGLNGTVTQIRGKNVVVAFGRWMEPEMPSWALRPVDESGQSVIDVHQPERDAA